MSEAEEVSAYDRLVWPEGQVEKWLVSGEHRRELVTYFGEGEYLWLRGLALAAAAVTPDPARVAYFVPGIMGTQLADARQRPLPDNLLWLDPTDVHHGQLTRLTLPGDPLITSGPVLYTWLPLKLALQAAGWSMRCFSYDWRRDLAEATAGFTRELALCDARNVNVIGHSMGGMIARAALRSPAGDRVRRLITLGTPHRGSFAPVQAVRGVYPLVRRLAQIDPLHSAEALSRDVFSSFHSLYQMLPRDVQPDLIDPKYWPRSGPQPNATLLARAPLFDPGPADARIDAIAGHGYLTATQVAQVEGEFWYRYDYGGDGTVPHGRAVLEGCRSWYCRVSHNELPRDAGVHAALAALLDDRRPDLAGHAPVYDDAPTRASDSQLRRQLTDKLDWAHMDSGQRRAYMDSLHGAPPAAPDVG